ncbi:hypothetical protein SM033_00297 [Vibrio phage vB_VpaM_sm033]|nr:hypothetical protein SM033_00297 [Vibrio phage vB_VpaM_sm033]
MSEITQFNGMVLETITKIVGLEKESDCVEIHTASGDVHVFYHEQDCCEYVRLNDFEGDAEDFVGALITDAFEITDYNDTCDEEGSDESYTWTFYKIQTNKGELWMRWLGESNGYYSEEVTYNHRKAKHRKLN